MTKKVYGATKDDWITLSYAHGLTADLLPVVSNPVAVISPKSTMKDKGKTPSIYNNKIQVAGIANWTAKNATQEEVDQWSEQEDYGICIQTRNIRALDIDVPDRALSAKIVAFINEKFPNGNFPTRSRANSGKTLLAFRVAGDFPKRKIKVNGGIIEFLANGQQFVAFGTHPSGTRYEWNSFDDFITLSRAEAEALWGAIVKEFGIEEATEGNATRKRGKNLHLADDIVQHLNVLSWGKDGQAFIECPWKNEHTMDSGETETAYFPKGTNGYERGHFKCLHAHCAGRTDTDYLEAFGVMTKLFNAPMEVEKTLPSFRRNKVGEIMPLLDNVCIAMENSYVCGYEIRFDNFRSEIMIAPEGTKGQWRQFSDNDITNIRRFLENNNFKPISRDMCRDAVNLIAERNIFDSAIEWLNDLPPWDGIERIDKFLPIHFGTEDNEYTRAVSRYIWTALAGRVLQPGVKADMIPILEGEQGLMKSTAIAAISPSQDFFIELSFHESDDNLARRMRGKLIGEIAELHGLHTKELEGIKAFATRTHENWIPKYKEFAVTFPRRLLLMATTNKKEILADETGNRRWLPVHVTKADLEGIKFFRPQLWAEAKAVFAKSGVYWQAENFAAEAHDEYSKTDIWQDAIVTWLDSKDLDGNVVIRDTIKTKDILRDALLIDSGRQDDRHAKRIGKIMRVLGYAYLAKRENSVLSRCWIKNS